MENETKIYNANGVNILEYGGRMWVEMKPTGLIDASDPHIEELRSELSRLPKRKYAKRNSAPAVRSRRKRLDPEKRIEVEKAIEDGMGVSEAKKKFGIASNTYYNIKKEMGGSKKKDNAEPENPDVIKVECKSCGFTFKTRQSIHKIKCPECSGTVKLYDGEDDSEESDE